MASTPDTKRDDPTPRTPRPDAWWGAIDVPRDGVVRIAAGSTRVWVERRRYDWQVYSQPIEDGDEGRVERPTAVGTDELPDAEPRMRFCFADAPGRLVVGVAQADRPIVVRPEAPLSVSPGERVTLFVSTPTWMVLSVERQRGARRGARPSSETNTVAQKLTELPLERPSDTWFGPSTVYGELCYALRTAGLLQLEALVRTPHSAITPLTIENKADDPLQFERVQVPVPQLGVYADARGDLWTNAVRLTRESSGDLAAVAIDSGAPKTARGGSERLAAPRYDASRGSVVRAFSRLLQVGGST
jgi:hypothetical protein